MESQNEVSSPHHPFQVATREQQTYPLENGADAVLDLCRCVLSAFYPPQVQLFVEALIHLGGVATSEQIASVLNLSSVVTSKKERTRFVEAHLMPLRGHFLDWYSDGGASLPASSAALKGGSSLTEWKRFAMNYTYVIKTSYLRWQAICNHVFLQHPRRSRSQEEHNSDLDDSAQTVAVNSKRSREDQVTIASSEVPPILVELEQFFTQYSPIYIPAQQRYTHQRECMLLQHEYDRITGHGGLARTLRSSTGSSKGATHLTSRVASLVAQGSLDLEVIIDPYGTHWNALQKKTRIQPESSSGEPTTGEIREEEANVPPWFENDVETGCKEPEIKREKETICGYPTNGDICSRYRFGTAEQVAPSIQNVAQNVIRDVVSAPRQNPLATLLSGGNDDEFVRIW